MNEKGCTDFAANWHKLCTVQGDETVNSWVMRSKVIKGHGRTTPKLVLETREGIILYLFGRVRFLIEATLRNLDRFTYFCTAVFAKNCPHFHNKMFYLTLSDS